jgi:DNA-binding transcriptional LysR family regulator
MASADRLGHIDLDLLYTFRAVVDAGGVVAASRRLGRSQPAISARLRQLEASIGVRLFERAGRGLALTLLGRAIDDEVTGVVAAAHRVLDRLQATVSEPVGLLRVGALPTVCSHMLPAAVVRFLARCPGARIDLRPGGDVEAQLDEVRRGELDVVVSIGRPPPGDLLIVPLREVTAVLAAPRRLKLSASVSVGRLRELPYVGYGATGDFFFDAVWRFLERAGVAKQVRVRVAHIQAIKGLVAEGAGVSILPDYTVRESSLRRHRVTGFRASFPSWIAMRESTRDVPLVARFREEVERITRGRPSASR